VVGGRRDALAINPQTAARLRAYLELAGHGDDIDGPLFRPLRPNGKRQDERKCVIKNKRAVPISHGEAMSDPTNNDDEAAPAK